MQRYFFHLHDGSDLPDETGTELADLATARVEAAAMAGQVLIDNPGRFWDQHPWKVDVRDYAGKSLFTLTISVDDHAARA